MPQMHQITSEQGKLEKLWDHVTTSPAVQAVNGEWG